jgi:toxin ParE1/3/4
VKPIRYHDEASAELLATVARYDLQREGLGAQFNAAVEHGLEAIRRSPTAFSLHDGVAIRRYVLRRFPYLILYQEFKDHIWILAVAHQRRDPDYWKSRRLNEQ